MIAGNEGVMGKSCEGDVLGLVSQCEKYVRRSGPEVKPSWGCCAVVKTVDVACVCKLVNKDIEQVIDMQKVVYVARSCGKTVAPGTNCGSKFSFSTKLYIHYLLLLSLVGKHLSPPTTI